LCFSPVKIRCSSLSILGITKKGCIVLWRYIYIFKSYARRFLEYQKRFFFFFCHAFEVKFTVDHTLNCIFPLPESSCNLRGF
jgi:hypothetical protein